MKATTAFKLYLNSIINEVDENIHNELWNKLIAVIEEEEERLREQISKPK